VSQSGEEESIDLCKRNTLCIHGYSFDPMNIEYTVQYDTEESGTSGQDSGVLFHNIFGTELRVLGL
jgi:hypothetical protein